MSEPIRVPGDMANPGQFFACCGLLELAARLWPGTTAAFSADGFIIAPSNESASLCTLFVSYQSAELRVGGATCAEIDRENDDGLASPMSLGSPFDLTLDWWVDKSLKPWAGSMNAELIFRAMRAAILPDSRDPLNDIGVVRDEAPVFTGQRRSRVPKKREPFYFDARRGSNAKALDIGFAPDAFSMTSAACPAVEALCIVGLQRFRPALTERPRVFDYWTWRVPLPPVLAAAAACGRLSGVAGERYRFENGFRTDQRKHKGFLPATRVNEGDTP